MEYSLFFILKVEKRGGIGSQIYSLTSSRDNESEQTLAWLTLENNEIMIRVARDSHSIALSTARDSATMKVTATVTMLFLSVTLQRSVATL
jgi:hypothetical protein